MRSFWEDHSQGKELIKAAFKIKSAEKNGFVTLIIERQIPANQRGIMLLDLESLIKDNIDDGISIWLEPVGDKSKLRNLRGINFKKDV